MGATRCAWRSERGVLEQRRFSDDHGAIRSRLVGRDRVVDVALFEDTETVSDRGAALAEAAAKFKKRRKSCSPPQRPPDEGVANQACIRSDALEKPEHRGTTPRESATMPLRRPEHARAA